ncbi:hypothetical protein O3P69_007439 [Scylla paramamosain]|uniref:Sushi domain-containing protein n=1 Tax=Scylla paramamosain TaxID=85552 RepID=A0AAW0V4D1_SCYPA
MLQAVAGNTLDGLGSVQNFTKKFSLRACPEGPDGGENTQASFTKNVAGTSVTITCKAGYRTNPGEATRGRSKCSHETLTWTPPSPNITCVEDKRCYRNPPNPINTRRIWDGQKEEGTEIVYSCRILYKTLTDEKSIYRCENKVWTLVTSEIKCDPPKCGDPPQVPDHGVLTYNSWDQITYQCDTYAIRSGVNSEHKISCKNFTWEELPKSFKCVGSDTYDAHQEWENFLNITLPVSTVLVFLVILCLLATRSDSPFCKICKGSTKEVSY